MTDVASPTGVPPGDGAGPVDVVDRSAIELVREYARLSGASLESPKQNLLRLHLNHGDERFFGGRREHLLALDIAAVELEPEAELPVIGGAFWTGLIAAIRARGGRAVDGVLPMTVSESSSTPDVAVLDASVRLAEQSVELHGVVRLVAKLSFAAGTTVEEELVESEALDLVTGQPVPTGVSEALAAPSEAAEASSYPHAARTPTERLLPALLRSLEARVEARIGALQQRADRELAHELARIDRYYTTLEAEVRREGGSGSSALQTIEREHQKRRAEEELRYRVRVEVQPVQVLERSVAAERVRWELASAQGVAAPVLAQRYLTGDGSWDLRCQRCGSVPEHLTVCWSGHAIGSECSAVCTVCTQRFCPEHGHAGCAIDDAPVCAADAEECNACGRVHCTDHRVHCEDGGHFACVQCVTACEICARAVCSKHATATHEDAPRGSRTLCSGCVTYCEGATSEPIGVDEAAACGTCGKDICENHQVLCVVDGRPHCSGHLRRADRSRRFVCEAHGAACDFEPRLLFAADEIQSCVECGKVSCNRHGAPCHEDQRWHCTEHLMALNDVTGAAGCAAHRTACHIDGKVYSMRGTTPCEICAGLTCRGHLGTCKWCGARACVKDMLKDRCVTCTKLAPDLDPPDEVVSAASALTGDQRVRAWHLARDGSRFVVQLDLGWTRRLVFSVPHGTAKATRVMKHSLLGSSKVG